MAQDSKDLEESERAGHVGRERLQLTGFDEILNRTIDRTIRGISGENADDIYSHMKNFGINIDRLGENPAALEKAMTEIFKVGWGVFRKAILRSLVRQLNISGEKFADQSFVECIEIAREEFENYAASNDGKQVANKVQNNELKAADESMVQLSLSHIESKNAHKTCKVCDKIIDTANTDRDRFIADLCNHCWEVQNSVWEFFLPIPNVSSRIEHKGGMLGF
ncbi:MAG: hypothetical protein ACRD38_05895 [Nitrososphaerales archaeon]